MSSIETSLESIDRLLAEAKQMPFTGKLLIDEEELSRLVEDIRLNMPVEITQAKKIAQERRDILNDAEAQAEGMIEEHQITKEAKLAADGILNQAREDANRVRSDAKAYAQATVDKADKWSDDICKSASAYVDKIIRDTDETLTKSVNDVRKLRQSVRGALEKSGMLQKPNFDE